MMDAALWASQTLHREAMDLAETDAKDLPAAFARERQAAELLLDRTDLEPTRSVVLRSAATLALECGDAAESRRLIERGLSGNPPPEIAAELRALLKTAQADGGGSNR